MCPYTRKFIVLRTRKPFYIDLHAIIIIVTVIIVIIILIIVIMIIVIIMKPFYIHMSASIKQINPLYIRLHAKII